MPLLLSEAVPYQADPTHEAAVALQKRTTPLVTGRPLAVTLPVSVTVDARREGQRCGRLQEGCCFRHGCGRELLFGRQTSAAPSTALVMFTAE